MATRITFTTAELEPRCKGRFPDGPLRGISGSRTVLSLLSILSVVTMIANFRAFLATKTVLAVFTMAGITSGMTNSSQAFSLENNGKCSSVARASDAPVIARIRGNYAPFADPQEVRITERQGEVNKSGELISICLVSVNLYYQDQQRRIWFN